MELIEEEDLGDGPATQHHPSTEAFRATMALVVQAAIEAGIVPGLSWVDPQHL